MKFGTLHRIADFYLGLHDAGDLQVWREILDMWAGVGYFIQNVAGSEGANRQSWRKTLWVVTGR